MENRNIIVVGGGIAGLMSAYILSIENAHHNIIIVEKEPECGGLLRKYDYGEYGIFDYGMHNLLETGIKELDDLIFALLPNDEWQFLEGKNRDLAGLFFNGKIQKESPFIDLRDFKEHNISVADFLNTIGTESSKDAVYNNVEEYFNARYGKHITKTVLKNIVEKFYKESINKLDILSSMVTPLSRVILFDQPLMDELNKSDILRDRLGYPEQRNLDLALSSGRKAYYPKKYGIHRVIDALIEKLKRNGVRFLLETEVSKISLDEQNQISTVYFSNDEVVKNVDQFIWTGNLFNLATLLDKNFKNIEFDRPPMTTVTNIVVDKKIALDDLYYLYCYDKSMNTFRVTAYYNYSEGAPRANGYPISIEMLIYDDTFDEKKMTKKALKEAKKMKLFAKDTNILFSKTELLKTGFPRPTIKNIASLDSIRNFIKDKSISNLMTTGILAEKNLFFQTHVLIDLYKKLKG